jgi:NADPH-dependent 2,4-dienoyl-CoA reductase/sulfur reductase-like enzyme
MTAPVVIVGASLAGVRTAEALRRHGYDGPLAIVGAEQHFPPFDRPPLSKQALVGGLEHAVRLAVAPDLAADVLLGRRATGLDLNQRQVLLDDGAPVSFAKLVVATGATAWVPGNVDPALPGVFTLRTAGDARALTAALDGRPAVAVIGGGVLGCEIAASCRAKGLDVVLIEPGGALMQRVLGAELGSWLARVHRDHGVDVRLSVSAERVTGAERVAGLRLSDGSEVAADVLVVATGARPEIDWLEGSGLRLGDGLVLDEYCLAPEAPGVAGAGDVARWLNPRYRRTMRVEHWDNAIEQADVVARNLLAPAGSAVIYDPVPYSWTDQYGLHLRFAGLPEGTAEIVDGSVEEGRFVAEYRAHGLQIGALCVNRPAKLVAQRKALREIRVPSTAAMAVS